MEASLVVPHLGTGRGGDWGSGHDQNSPKNVRVSFSPHLAEFFGDMVSKRVLPCAPWVGSFPMLF